MGNLIAEFKYSLTRLAVFHAKLQLFFKSGWHLGQPNAYSGS